jgi:hypothetical protein
MHLSTVEAFNVQLSLQLRPDVLGEVVFYEVFFMV